MEAIKWYQWLLVIFTFGVFPLWCGYLIANERHWGAPLTITFCTVWISFFLIGAAIKYWYA